MTNTFIEKYKIKIKNVGIYFLASLVPMLFALLANPFIASNMEPQDYGITGFYMSFNLLLQPFISFYFIHYFTKRYFELDEIGRDKLKAVTVQALVYFSFILGGIGFLGIFIYMYFFNEGTTIPFFPFAFLSVFTIPMTGLFNLMLVDAKMKRQSLYFFKLSITNGLLTLALIFTLVVVFKLGALGRLSGVFLGALMIFSWCILKNKSAFKQKFDTKIFLAMLRFCWPLAFAGMLSFFSSGYDRILLERLGNTSELGYYIVAIQVVGYITVFSTAINATFQPDIYESIIKGNSKKTLSIFLIILLLNLIMVIVFIWLAPFLIDVLTAGKYTYSAKYARIIVFSQLSQTIYHFISQYTIAKGYNYITLINKIVGSILTTILFSILISKWGFMGAAWGQTLAYLIFILGNLTLLFFVINKKNINEKNSNSYFS
jgi:O-antigen/teichoic acid export membrane protein